MAASECKTSKPRRIRAGAFAFRSAEFAAVITMNTSGSFVVAWQGADADGRGIWFQRINAQGVAQGSESPANTTSAHDQYGPSAGIDGTGNFLIAWTSSGQDGDGESIFAQRITADDYGLIDAAFLAQSAPQGAAAQPATNRAARQSQRHSGGP